MQNENSDEIQLKEIWSMIVKKMNKEGEQEVCPNSSSFYKTQDGLECSLRKKTAI